MILAGDIGGTKSNLALFRHNENILQSAFQCRLTTREYSSFDALIDEFYARAAKADINFEAITLQAAGFGAAGAVVDGKHYSTNLPWRLDAAAMAKKLNLPQVFLLNDLFAMASGLLQLPASDFVVLNPGAPAKGGTKGVIAAGTGLGEALLFWDGNRYRVTVAEGGQTDFAPRTDREVQLLVHLKSKMPQVITEEIISGRGFRRIHEFLDPIVQHESFAMPSGNAAGEITQRGMDGSCPICVNALHFWAEIFGGVVRNFALQTMSLAGIYIAGGVTVKVLPKLQEDVFFKAFCGEGKLAPMLANIPIHVVLNEDAPLLGAAYEALDSISANERFAK